MPDPLQNATDPVADDLLDNLPLLDDDGNDPGSPPPAAAGAATPPTDDATPPQDGAEPTPAQAGADEVPAANGATPAEAAAEPPVEASPAAGDASTTTTPAAAAPAAAPAQPPAQAPAAAPPAPAADPDAEFWRAHDALLQRLERGEVETVDLKAAELAIIARGNVKVRERTEAVAREQRDREAARSQQDDYARGWEAWQKANPAVAGGRQIWEQELAKAQADPENGTPAEAMGAARVLFKQRVAIAKAAAARTKPAPAAAVAAPAAAAKGRTSVAPLTTGARPAGREPSPDEEFDRDFAGSAKNFLAD